MANPNVQPQASTSGGLVITQAFQKHPYMMLGMIACIIKGYNRRTSPKQYFIETKERTELDDWTEDTRLKIVKYRLEGETKNFYDTELASEAQTLTWNSFKNKIINKFTPKMLPGESALQLSKCYQRNNETQAETQAIKKKIGDILLQKFQMGLKRDLKRQVLPQMVSEAELTIEKAEQIALRQELCDEMMGPPTECQ
ncbi:hypothetical protein ILUMI_15620 [Ignelater luminosus]|uniref:Uncharacterized protein n=1 Tax=Ignelater luminosus TaxID=2038154 RepID=A0A8K0CTR3_IGNLU|nr:hypothetical protein ILUMI_15620 [Ignelater luminosus]